MSVFDVLKNEYLSVIFGGLAGVLTAWVTQRVLNKRGLFSYYVNHNRVGMSTDDSIFGKVSVMWNNNPIRYLFFSTLELKNESLNDYENIVIKTYTTNTNLLSESTQIMDTPNIIEWTDKFKNQFFIENDQKPTEAQVAIYNSQREYFIPVFNRGQIIRISYLNSATSDEVPSIWLSALVKGVKVKFRIPQRQIYGELQPYAAVVGVLIGLILIFPIVIYVQSEWVAVSIAMIYGFIAQIPGALFLKMSRKIREIVGG